MKTLNILPIAAGFGTASLEAPYAGFALVDEKGHITIDLKNEVDLQTLRTVFGNIEFEYQKGDCTEPIGIDDLQHATFKKFKITNWVLTEPKIDDTTKYELLENRYNALRFAALQVVNVDKEYQADDGKRDVDVITYWIDERKRRQQHVRDLAAVPLTK